jgi:hypothetical protein
VLALDCASTEFYDAKKKRYTLESTGEVLTSDEMVAMWADWEALPHREHRGRHAPKTIGPAGRR